MVAVGLAVAPAALGATYCVNDSDPSCTSSQATIAAALSAAGANPGNDAVRIGAGTYSDGPFAYTSGSGSVAIRGAGQGVTALTAPANAAAQNYLALAGSSVSDLTIQLQSSNPADDAGLLLTNGASAQRVRVEGTGTFSAIGARMQSSSFSDGTISMPIDQGHNARGVDSTGGSTVTDSEVSGRHAFFQSAPGMVDTISRSTLRADGTGVSTESGEVDIDDSVIDLGTADGAAGLVATNETANPGVTTMAIVARHLTIVGGGANSYGALAFAINPDGRLTSTISLDDSVITGQTNSLLRGASNNGAQGGSSRADIVTNYSNYDPFTASDSNGANGVGTITATNQTNLSPGFANPALGDYHLGPGSALVDIGNPAAGGPATDRDGNARVRDGDGDTGARRDIGAYELVDLAAPETTIDSGPSGPTGDSTATFGFSSELGASFECRLSPSVVFSACSGPGASHTTAPLADGPYTFSVRATDVAANVDATPAERSFTVDTTAPETTITKAPPAKISRSTAKFKFSANEVGATFACKMDNKPFEPCTSPAQYTVGRGKHTFRVQATDVAGNTGPVERARFKRT